MFLRLDIRRLMRNGFAEIQKPSDCYKREFTFNVLFLRESNVGAINKQFYF